METLNHIAIAIIFFLCGLFLFLSSLVVFVIFIGYRELRTGVYSIILLTTLSEIYFGLHSIIGSISGIVGRTSADLFCKIEAGLSVFFILNWCFQNLNLMLLIYMRKLGKTKFGKYLHLLTFIFSGLLVALIALDDSLGLSFYHSCFIKHQTKSLSVAFLIGVMFSLLLISLLYNLWYLCFRDKSVDRNIINSYNYFILLSSLAYFTFALDNALMNYFNIYSQAFNIVVIFMLCFCQIYIGYFRLQIEYVQVVLKSGPVNNRFLNALLLLICVYKRPKFKEIKKVVNVKFVSNLNETENTIYSHISKTSMNL
jgi:hypothetical protein